MSGFQWDPEKEALNIEKHGIDFTTASQIWQAPVYEQLDDRRDYGEIRFVASGIADNRILTVVFTWRRDVRRIISARIAKCRERVRYEREVEQRGRPRRN